VSQRPAFAYFLEEQRVRLEVWLLPHLKAKEFGWIVGELLPAVIAANRQTEINARRGHEGIGFPQGVL